MRIILLLLICFVLGTFRLEAQVAILPGLDEVDRIYELQLVSGVTETDLPTSGKGLLVVARMEDSTLHFRLFNTLGTLMVDQGEAEIPLVMQDVKQAELEQFRSLVEDYFAPGAIVEPEQSQHIIHQARLLLGLLTTRELRPQFEYQINTLEKLMGLSGLLAGFMMAVVFTLTHLKRRAIVAWTLFTSAVSAAGFSTAAFIATFVVIVGNNALNNATHKVSLVDYYAGAISETLQIWGGVVMLLIFLSSFAFTSAIGLCGWMYSNLMGILTSVVGVGALLLMAGSVASIVMVFNT